MAAPKKPGGNAGKGRTKGVPNKVTADLKEMILGALNAQDGGGQGYLERQARETPGPFMTLLGKIIPTQVTGADGKDLIPPTDPGKVALVLLGILRGAEKGE